MEEDIPSVERLPKIPGGRCLDHVHRLLDLSEAVAERLVVAQGVIAKPGGEIKHCWLETVDGGTVFDLTTREVRHSAGDYYAQIRPKAVRKYSHREAIERLLRIGVEFWEV